MAPEAPAIRAGEIVAQRVFDVAYAIDLAQLEQRLQAQPGTASRRRRLNTAPPKAVAFDVPPLVLELEVQPLVLETGAVQARVSVRFYDFGVVSLALRVEVADCAWPDYVALVNAIDRAVGPASASLVWASLLERVAGIAGPAYTRPAVSMLQEDYLYASVREFDQPLKTGELQERIDLVPLLSGETRALAEGTRRDLLRHSFSYYDDDWVVLTWERAFLYDPRGDTDVADILEVANAQLLEMRYYDELLDAELPRMYDLVEVTQRALWAVAPSRYARLARKLHGLVAEVTELKEKVDNALQVTEDVYLARIYSAALDQLRVPGVSQTVDRKLAIIRDTYIALYDEASSRRAEFLEATIVLLILIELVLALMPSA